MRREARVKRKIRKLLCKWFGHDLVFDEWVSRDGRRRVVSQWCDRCSAYFGMEEVPLGV